MSAIKIVFFDIDGTLIDMNKKRISEKMLETLRRLKENGTDRLFALRPAEVR